MVPKAQTIAVLMNPANAQNQVQLDQLREAARATRLNVVSLNASSRPELESSFARMADALWESRSDPGAAAGFGRSLVTDCRHLGGGQVEQSHSGNGG